MNKKAETGMLATIFRIILNMVLIFFVIGILGWFIYTLIMDEETPSRLESNMVLIKNELRTIQEGECSPAPALKPERDTEYRYLLRQKDDTDFSECKRQPCICIAYFKGNSDLIEKKCEIFEDYEFANSEAQVTLENEKSVVYLKKEDKIFLVESCTSP